MWGWANPSSGISDQRGEGEALCLSSARQQPDGLGRLLGGDRCLLFWVFKRKLKKGKRRLSQTETQRYSSLTLALELRPYLSTDVG